MASTRRRTASGRAKSAARPVKARPAPRTRLLDLAALRLEGGTDTDDVRTCLRQRFGHRQSDPAPRAGDDSDPTGEVERVAHATAPSWQSTSTFITPTGLELGERLGRCRERQDRRDEGIRRDHPGVHQLHRALEVRGARRPGHR